MGRLTEYIWYLNHDILESQLYWYSPSEKDRKLKMELRKQKKVELKEIKSTKIDLFKGE